MSFRAEDNRSRGKKEKVVSAKERLHSFVEKAISEGGFEYYLTDYGVRMYKRFEERTEDTLLIIKMQKCSFDKKPLSLNLYSGRTQKLLWNNKLERLVVLSKEVLLKMEEEEKGRKKITKKCSVNNQKGQQKKKVVRRHRKTKSWQIKGPASNFDMISSSSGSGFRIIYHHNGPKR